MSNLMMHPSWAQILFMHSIMHQGTFFLQYSPHFLKQKKALEVEKRGVLLEPHSNNMMEVLDIFHNIAEKYDIEKSISSCIVFGSLPVSCLALSIYRPIF